MTSIEDQLAQETAKAARALGELADSVIILCTLNRDGEDLHVCHEVGSSYANRGIVEEWIEKQREFARCCARRKSAEPSDLE